MVAYQIQSLSLAVRISYNAKTWRKCHIYMEMPWHVDYHISNLQLLLPETISSEGSHGIFLLTVDTVFDNAHRNEYVASKIGVYKNNGAVSCAGIFFLTVRGLYNLSGGQLPVAMKGPEGLLCFLTRTTPVGFKKLGWSLILWSKQIQKFREFSYKTIIPYSCQAVQSLW